MDFSNPEIAPLRSRRRQKDFFSGLIDSNGEKWIYLQHNIEEDRLEYVRCKAIVNMEHREAGQIVLRVRNGHTPRKAITYRKYLKKKEWKR